MEASVRWSVTFFSNSQLIALLGQGWTYREILRVNTLSTRRVPLKLSPECVPPPPEIRGSGGRCRSGAEGEKKRGGAGRRVEPQRRKEPSPCRCASVLFCSLFLKCPRRPAPRSSASSKSWRTWRVLRSETRKSAGSGLTATRSPLSGTSRHSGARASRTATLACGRCGQFAHTLLCHPIEAP